jgi:exonuclease SbcC
MVPVRLELQNFLSYGTDAPALDFEAFDVACLSGRNGQGKSALLDAITWAVWGEARKSSGRRKPDEELIRIGTRHMQVAFTFDLDGVRYRVQRTFTRSATGKTTDSALEFQMKTAAASGDGAASAVSYKPLTGSTQRETQQRIEDTLGLTYETFINSAFLLQGRSDEFTKKSPSQRKEILVNILNLERYEDMGRMARQRVREARRQRNAAANEVERLQEQLADVPAWKEKRAAVRQKIDAAEATLRDLRDDEKRLTERQAELDAKAREAESLRDAMDRLDARIEQDQEEIAVLDDRIEEADALIAKSETIRQDYERYEALQDERNALDEKRDLHRGLEKRLDQARSQLQDRRRTLESKLDRLKVERKSFEQSRTECQNTLTQRSRVAKKLKAAQAARQRKTELDARRQKREDVRQQIEAAERELVGLRQQLQGEHDALQQQIQAAQRTLQAASGIEARLQTLEEKAERRAALHDEMETVERKGKSASEALQSRRGEVEAKQETLQQQQDALQRFRQVEDQQTCPTCGTDLTPTHRRTVESTLQERIDTLQDTLDRLTADAERLAETRDRLRQRYATLRDAAADLEDVPEQRARAREQKRIRNETRAKLQTLQENAQSVQQRIQNRDYGADIRQRRQRLKQTLREIPFDASVYDDVQQEAAQVERYQERLQEMKTLQGRVASLTRKIDQHNTQIQELRTALDEGTAFGDRPQQIERLEAQLEQVAFDPERLQEVRRSIGALRQASERMKDLVHAQQNRDDWNEQRARIQTRIEEAQRERAEKSAALQEVQQELEATDEIRAQQKANAKAMKDAEATLADLRQTLGQLQQRLDTAQEHRKALQSAKQTRADAEEERATYAHLRTAFSKHGIPSLIIEETLPDIEERANVLLDRLTDSAMRVRLETLKQKKSGGTKETLEIIITDEQGVPRPYETFSGGESFRVNFALRIAMAQLLAERSGVRVRTLVIDEGFGTQDEQGIQRLVEAIEAIREDFAKVLVITHLPRLKQAFPVRIEVEKDPVTGSSFEVVGV